jgi:hypothetical protein
MFDIASEDIVAGIDFLCLRRVESGLQVAAAVIMNGGANASQHDRGPPDSGEHRPAPRVGEFPNDKEEASEV